jgi:guanylate kinase
LSKQLGHLFIISAPAGTGKTTLVNMLTEKYPQVIRNVTCTTREPRPGEVDGKDYYFLTEEEFQKNSKQVIF